MGTRGWLIFKFQGIYYVFFNSYDSYPSHMGRKCVEQIIALMKAFRNCKKDALNHWKELFSKLTFYGMEAVKAPKEIPEERNPNILYRSGPLIRYIPFGHNHPDGQEHPWNKNYVYENIEEHLKVTDIPVEVTKWTFPPYDGSPFIEYSYEIDLDTGRFGAGGNFARFYWSWKELTQMGAGEWEEAAEDFFKGDSGLLSHWKWKFLAVQLSSLIRGVAVREKAYIPPDGVLFKLAKKRFEHSYEKNDRENIKRQCTDSRI